MYDIIPGIHRRARWASSVLRSKSSSLSGTVRASSPAPSTPRSPARESGSWPTRRRRPGPRRSHARVLRRRLTAGCSIAGQQPESYFRTP